MKTMERQPLTKVELSQLLTAHLYAAWEQNQHKKAKRKSREPNGSLLFEE